MKINEIVEAKPEPQMQSEKHRAQKEYETLIRFDAEFANLFKTKFQSMPDMSVDAAYQWASTTMAERKKKQAGTGRGDQAANEFISAIPNTDTKQKNIKDGKIGYAAIEREVASRDDTGQKIGSTGTRGGQLGNQNARKNFKGLRQALQIGKNLWQGASVSQGYATGREELGNRLKDLMGTGLKKA